jgi:signal transduction histidine kinase
MNRLFQAVWRKLCASGLLLLLLCWCSFPAANAGQMGSELPSATNVSELRRIIPAGSGRICAYDLEGTILAADGSSGILFFQDDSGTTALNVDLKGLELKSGQRVRLRGTNYTVNMDAVLSLGTYPLVDDDYLHPTTEKFSEIYLKAGQHPIQVIWFNRTFTYFLQVEYSGPHLARQTIPASALFQSATDSKSRSTLPGLRYRCFEGQWEKLPDFNSLVPQKSGTVSNFDIAVKTRDENVGLEFTGFLEVPDDGIYKFYLSSDDGSQLFLNKTPTIISTIGTALVPIPQPAVVSQLLPDGQDCLWAETEGTITFMSRYKGHVEFELTAGEKQMRVEVLSASSEVPWYLLNSRVHIRGICSDIKNTAGQKYAGAMVVADWRDVRVLDVAPGQWSAFRNVTLNELTNGTLAGSNGMAYLQGHLHLDPATQMTRLQDSTGSAPIELLTGLPAETNSDIECLSQWSWDGTNIFLHEAVARESLNQLGGKTNAIRVLTTAMQVQRLTRAEGEYPVEIQGIVTWTASDQLANFVIQDSTHAVFVAAGDEFSSHFPSVGDYCRLEGISQSADFSPIVSLRKITILWRGQMPQPVSPTRDQLLSGSLDAQYVEVRGLVIATHDTYMTLLTADGILDLDITPAPSGQWQAYLNSIIRVRGCLFANWDAETHRVILDQPIPIKAATISIDSLPPTDLFAANTMRARNLMGFDVRFDTFRRVKIHGQIIHSGADMYYLMDDTTGLRFRPAQPLRFDPGDEVEVVGLVELGGASPVLRQTVARKTGHRPLPEPRQISINSLSNNYDSTLVSMEGTLVNVQNHGSEQILELQVGVKSFVARLDFKQQPATAWAIGSHLKIAGTFCALDGDRMTGRDVNSFELLLNSPDDVQVMARPPWWTLSRLLLVVTCLLVGLTLAFAWITLLRRQVERRTRQLGREISERERAEKLRAIEHERSRIARDLHDDLGSTLTEISMLATASPGLKMGSEIATDRLREIAEKSRSMVSALDGVVWVVNSKNDTLSSLVEYLASYAEEFLAKAKIACRIELPKHYSERIIAAEIRHELMLAVREAFNNAVRHGQPNEMVLRMIIAGESFEILIHDNGRGFDPIQAHGNGLGNLQQRMEKLKGSCQIDSSSRRGTTVTFKLPL